MTEFQNITLDLSTMSTEQFTELVTCIVCKEIPEAEVLQCKEGHAICKHCFSSPRLRECPVCYVSYAGYSAEGFQQKLQIRNRAFEAFLDAVRLHCVNVSHGCQTMLKRSEIKVHSSSCQYRQSTRFCEQLGLNCSYLAHRGDLAGVADHLKNVHAFHEIPSSSFRFRLTPRFQPTIDVTPSFIRLYDSTGNEHLFIIMPSLSSSGDLFSISVIEVGNFAPRQVSSFRVRLSVLGQMPQAYNMEQFIIPQNFLDCGNPPSQRTSTFYQVGVLQQHFLTSSRLVVDFEIREY